MKTNKLILKILFLYFSIFFVLFTAFYLMMPKSFNGLVVFLNMVVSCLILLISMGLVYKNTKYKKDKDCDIIYFICKNIPIIMYFISIFTSVLVILFFKNKNTMALSLLEMFGTSIFYIFSKNYFEEILEFSESNFRSKTTSITILNRFSKDIPATVNLVLQILPLIILNLLISVALEPLSIGSSIYIVYLVLISIISLIYISLDFYNTLNKIADGALNINYNNELGKLAYTINSNNQRYDNYINELKDEQAQRTAKERLSSVEMIRRTVDAKDSYTRGHSDRVSEYAVLLGEKLGASDKNLELLRIGGLFHDIGKIGIPDSILLKNGKLTDDEYNEIKKHPQIGAYILENSNIFEKVIPIVLNHHERFDGSGYPNGLKGNEIPYMARIVAVADTFDAMTSRRSYRDALLIDTVKQELERCSGAQFDPDIVKEFIYILDNEYERIEEIMKL